MVFHYAQEIFEGMKAYRTADDTIQLFRPECNAKRFQDSADRLCIPKIPEEDFVQAVEALVDVERDWVPHTDGASLYIRPFIFANDVGLAIRYVLDNCPDEMAFFNQFIDKGLIERLELVANSEFGRISYTDAIEILKKNNKKFQFPVEWGVDIQTEHERYLTEVVFKKPVFVTDYPKEIKSFYMKQNPDGKTVAAADMLVPGIGELIGGSQREEDYDKLVTRMDELGLDKSSYDWYLNLRKFGGVEHAGYGLGFERMIMYLTGIQNIRDVLPFPRTAYGF